MDLVRQFEEKQIKDLERPRLNPGDVVRVETKIKEGEKERLQGFEGVVLGIKGSGPSTTFTVRREVGRFAVERVFPLYSPLITDIAINQRQKVRRAKLNYLREAGRRRVKHDEKAMERHLEEKAKREQVKEEPEQASQKTEEKAE